MHPRCNLAGFTGVNLNLSMKRAAKCSDGNELRFVLFNGSIESQGVQKLSKDLLSFAC